MKIGVFDPYLDDLGGGEKYMMSVVEFLLKNHEVDVFWDNEEDIKKISNRFSLDLSKAKIVPNIFSPNTSTIQRFKKSMKYDALIILSDGSIPLVSSRLYIHIQQPLGSMQSGLLRKIKLARVRAVFCNSEFTRSFIDKDLREKTRIIYPPVSIHAKKAEKENIILHVGRFRVKNVKAQGGDYKKQNVMIDSFKEMVDKGLSGWKLVIATSVNESEKGEFEKMKNKAKNFPVEYLINKTNEELWDIYSRAKIYWHASGWGEDLEKHPELAEHFGISTVEAMGAGAVPVVIGAGGQKEIITDGFDGYLWENLEEFKEKTTKLIKDDELREKIQEKAKLRAKDFSKEEFQKNIAEMIG